jgi:hypothetical protein
MRGSTKLTLGVTCTSSCVFAGEEEVPLGVVGVIVLGDCPDVLSHCAVRARNCKIPVVACPRCGACKQTCTPKPAAS